MIDYLSQFQEKYQEVINKEKSIYTIELPTGRFIFVLPDKKRPININNSIRLTEEDARHLVILFPKTPVMELINKDIFKYQDPRFSDALSLSNLEELLKDGRSRVCELGVSVPNLAHN